MDRTVVQNIYLEKMLSYSALVFFVAGLILYFGKEAWWPDFYHPRFFAAVFLASGVSIILSKYVLKAKDGCEHDAAIRLRAAIAFALIANGLGELYLYQLYKYGLPYDKVMHFLAAAIFVAALSNYLEARKTYTAKKALRLAIGVIIAGGLAWEAFEFTSDSLFKTTEAGIYGKYKVSDTLKDIFLDILGATGGAIVLLSSKARKEISGEYCYKQRSISNYSAN